MLGCVRGFWISQIRWGCRWLWIAHKESLRHDILSRLARGFPRLRGKDGTKNPGLTVRTRSRYPSQSETTEVGHRIVPLQRSIRRFPVYCRWGIRKYRRRNRACVCPLADGLAHTLGLNTTQFLGQSYQATCFIVCVSSPAITNGRDFLCRITGIQTKA